MKNFQSVQFGLFASCPNQSLQKLEINPFHTVTSIIEDAPFVENKYYNTIVRPESKILFTNFFDKDSCGKKKNKN
jgi:hypothetical protein